MAEAYVSVELPCSVPGIGYTLKHRECVAMLIEYFCSKVVGKADGNGEVFTAHDLKIMRNRAKMHDVDKMIVSLAYPQLTSDYFHRMFNGHHEESMIEPQYKSKYDWIEMIMDMESARYTKKDKQGGGAYWFASTYKPHVFGYMLPYFQLFGLDVEMSPMVESVVQQLKGRKYYEKDLVDCILNYMHTTRIHLLDGLARIDDEGYMKVYGSPVPYRQAATQHPNGTVHHRPNEIAQQSRSIMSRELVHGDFQAQLFDYDAIALLRADEVKGINDSALQCLEELKANGCQR